MKKINATFTDGQVKNINEYQVNGTFHPFTCTSGSHLLVAKNDGMHCPICQAFLQTWVWDGMADGSWDAERLWKIIEKKHGGLNNE